MKARTIKKLRKEIKDYKTYKVTESYGLFGDFYCIGSQAPYKIIRAKDEVYAIKRWFKWYERYNKEKSKFHFTTSFEEASSDFAHFKVIDEKGFIKYYR